MVKSGGDARSAWQMTVLKIASGGAVECVLQASEPIWVDTHWIGVRQWLCVGGCRSDEPCPACWSCDPRRVGFIVVVCVVNDKSRPFLLEVTSRTWAQLRSLAEMDYGGVTPGMLVRLSRRGPKSAVRAEPLAANYRFFEDLHEWRRCVGAMAVLFGLPIPTPDQSLEDWSARVEPAARMKLTAAIAQASKTV